MKNLTRAFDHWPLVILIAVFCVLAGSFSLLLPLNEVPDEQSHFDLIRFIAEKNRFPLTNQERVALGDKGDASPFYHGVVALLSQHVDVSSLPQRHLVSEAKRSIPYDTTLTTQELHTEDELFPFRGIVLAWHLARLVSVPLSALTVVAAYLTALAIYPQKRYFALAVAGFLAFVPRFVINSAVVSDDNLVIPLIAFAIYFMVRIIQGDDRLRSFVFLGALSGLATITKYHSLVLLLETTLVFFILALRNRGEWKKWLKRWSWVMLSFVVTTGWWFLFLFSRFNRVAELGLVAGLLAPLGDPTTTEAATFRLTPEAIRWDWVTPVFRTFWVVAGSMRIFAPDYVYQVLIVLTVLAALGLARLLYNRFACNRHKIWRLDIILLALHLLLYLGIVFGRYQVFVARGTPPPPHSTQGRHLYPAITSIAFFFVLGWQSVLAMRPWRPKRGDVQSPNNRFLAGVVTLGLLTLTLATFFFVIRPSYQTYLPIVNLEPEQLTISHRANVALAEGINFVGYNLEASSKRADNVLPIHLYWQSNAEQNRDYIASVCLHDGDGNMISCHWGHPADGRYPTRAWDVGYLIRDERNLPFPSCLAPDDYELTLSTWPLRNDSALTMIDETEPAQEPLLLGSVTLAPESQRPEHEVLLCIADDCYTKGQMTLSQTRQTVTFVSHQLNGTTARFVLNNTDATSPKLWLPFKDTNVYYCPDEQAFQTHTFIVDESVPPGSYTLEVNNQPKQAFSVRVNTPPRNFDSPPEPKAELGISFANQLDLLGYDADLSPRWPDDSIEVTTYWQTRQRTPHIYNVALHLLDSESTTQLLSDHFLGGLYPNVIWAPGEFTQDSHILQASDQVPPPGLYTLELRLYDYSQGSFEPLAMANIETNQPIDRSLVLGEVRIMDPGRKKLPSYPRVVNLGQEIQLLGYDLTDTHIGPGQSLSFALHWKAISQPSTDYTVFTQLIGPDGLVWGQQDNQPQQGRYPTTAWAVEDRVVDRYDIPLRADVPRGSYRLLVGIYDLATGERLPAIDQNGQRLPADAIVLSTIEIVGEQ
jgi:hypothetical protein